MFTFVRNLSAICVWSIFTALSWVVFWCVSLVFVGSFVLADGFEVFGMGVPEIRSIAGELWLPFLLLFLSGKAAVAALGLLSSINDKLDDF
jgi:hypothetical protein